MCSSKESLPNRHESHLTPKAIRRLAQWAETKNQLQIENATRDNPELRHLVQCRGLCKGIARKIGVVVPGMIEE
jgi:hypothetical protein